MLPSMFQILNIHLPTLHCAWSHWIGRANPVWSHHLIVFMFNNVTMPGKLTGMLELRFDAGNFAGVGNDRILESSFPGFGRARRTAINYHILTRTGDYTIIQLGCNDQSDEQ